MVRTDPQLSDDLQGAAVLPQPHGNSRTLPHYQSEQMRRIDTQTVLFCIYALIRKSKRTMLASSCVPNPILLVRSGWAISVVMWVSRQRNDKVPAKVEISKRVVIIYYCILQLKWPHNFRYFIFELMRVTILVAIFALLFVANSFTYAGHAISGDASKSISAGVSAEL